MISVADILLALQILVALLVILLLYHCLFIAVDTRKIIKRVDMLTEEVQEVILKPISMADSIVEFVSQWLEEQQKKGETKKNSKSKKLKG